ncbi:UDP-N-acetylmuramoyl-L-alanyl-D-glutamate--2,6-diaminopimelate ligase [Tessaracoccus sp. MC1865]|nr:UDP-N-acetylmuramoyl-L-alanyl-D-glutamate--2,6-diaminopimelate ligase [Tessaracoccus sp. MC1865]MBB1483600.1 UDP-N-acetylmuramoyl-L-alanyl-D-glutamate--2,6-diaminopimelate ligase [Tessaracoccus sp. MC1865]QTO36682.1 UDP-N-acetylmuramoyl-L-alanyl-D-glutamate--2,6-diaminopimelate ligase [Tessaracoccus sp. MC1865]
MTSIRPTETTAAPLTELVAGLDLVGDIGSSAPITGISLSSQEILPGWLYVALPGRQRHGADFARAAVDAGAAAVLTDDEGAARLTGLEVPVLVAGDVRAAMAVVSARIFGEPARRLTTLGVTGTNGKTTTVALIKAGLMAAGRVAGTIGTIGFRLGGEELNSSRSTVTTPESPDLQALLAVMEERGADSVAVEVSSHAMALSRVDAIEFDVAAFLNLGRDHLDFHHTLEEYFAAKSRLFEPGRARTSVVWTDDSAGVEIAGRVAGHGQSRLITAGTGPEVDYRMSDYRPVHPLGGIATVTRGGEDLTLELSLPGVYNMIDAVVALAMLEAVGVPVDAALRGLATAQIPGRMQRVHLGPDAPLTVVDFAHTPQAVEAALRSLQGIGTLVCVLGCGGDRDVEKRPEMGAVAASLSDVTIITDDNPRSEDPAAIRAEVMAGARRTQRPGAELLEVPGRRAAIETALGRAGGDTVVAILGKGHERGQILADRTIDFDDVEEAAGAWGRGGEEGDPHARAHDV